MKTFLCFICKHPKYQAKLLQFQTQVKFSTAEILDKQPVQHRFLQGLALALIKIDTEDNSSEMYEVQ